MAETAQQVSLVLRKPDDGPLARQLPAEANVLSFSLAGNGEIDLSLVAKKPGAGLESRRREGRDPAVRLAGADPLPPYVRLIHDVLIGDRSLFTRPDGLAAVWKVAEPLLSSPPKVASYAARIVGTGAGAQARRARPLAARPVAATGRDQLAPAPTLPDAA